MTRTNLDFSENKRVFKDKINKERQTRVTIVTVQVRDIKCLK